MSVYPRRQQLRDFVDALRLCMGLAPLYKQVPAGLPVPYLNLYAGKIGEGCRRAQRGVKT